MLSRALAGVLDALPDSRIDFHASDDDLLLLALNNLAAESSIDERSLALVEDVPDEPRDLQVSDDPLAVALVDSV